MKLLLTTYAGDLVTVELDLKKVAAISITSICDDEVAYVWEHGTGICTTYDSFIISSGKTRMDYPMFREPRYIYKNFASFDSVPQLNKIAEHNLKALHDAKRIRKEA